ncbi:MAG: methyltransferase domain-containing protein, partial [Aliifodinibius sp.]|nr:class I SAM-dependent methyltransferase [Fodinibius sp.]NIV12049.1 methyltransferase domain-containing protein [Fodinibius sp.]NIY25696.1 methyltransferase domain-containing protein [Fodinibius sp.]
MLKEHLSQDHDLASRRIAIVDRHVEWIHSRILNKKPSKILDLCCGPGFYASRLSGFGHECRGIDFSPASIEYARKNMTDGGKVEYYLEDISTADYGRGYDLVLLIYGEFNVFPRSDVLNILRKCHLSLNDTGQILIEAHTFNIIKNLGESGNSWSKEKSGLFSDRPYLCLTQNRWYDSVGVAQTDYIIIDAETANIDIFKNTLQAYTPEKYKELFDE